MNTVNYKGYTIETLDGYNYAEVYKNGKITGIYYNIDIAIDDINKIIRSSYKIIRSSYKIKRLDNRLKSIMYIINMLDNDNYLMLGTLLYEQYYLTARIIALSNK